MSNEAIAREMIAHYNAQNADAFVAYMTVVAAEASYRGDVVRDGMEGVRSGLKASDRVIANPSARLYNGQKIMINE